LIGTVLVADDSPTIQKKASGILTGEGLEVVTVSNGVAAIKKLSTIKPQIVLADCSMPGKDGYEVCEFVKNSSDLSHVPVLLIVSDLEPYDDERGMRVRADGRVTKPFIPDDLISTVTGFLSRAASAPEAAAPDPPPPPELPPPPMPEFSIDPMQAMDDPSLAAHSEADHLSGIPQDIAFSDPLLEAPAMQPEGLHVAEGAPLTETPMEEVGSYPPELEVTPEPLLEPTQVSGETSEIALDAGQEMPPIFTYDVNSTHLAAESAPPSSRHRAERTMMFRSPLHIAEPSLHDELAPPEPAIVLPPVEPVAEEPEPSLSASTLESYSLDEAASGHVQFAAAEETLAEGAKSELLPVEESAPSLSEGEPFAEVPSELAMPPVDSHPAPEGPVEETPAAASAIEPAELAEEAVEPPPPEATEGGSAALEEPRETAETSVTEEAAAPPLEESAVGAAIPEEPAMAEEASGETPLEEPAPVWEAAAPPGVAEEPQIDAEPAPEISEPPVAAEEALAAPEAAAEESATPGAEVEEPSPAPPPAIDPEVLRTIVQTLVARMSPPALSPAAVEELTENLFKEIAADLAGSEDS
jgi:CheY-like chemotaxis protein